MVTHPATIEDPSYPRNALRLGVVVVVDAAVGHCAGAPPDGLVRVQAGWLRERAGAVWSVVARQLARSVCAAEAQLRFIVSRPRLATRFVARLLAAAVTQLVASARCSVPVAPGLVLDITLPLPRARTTRPATAAASLATVARAAAEAAASTAARSSRDRSVLLLDPSASLIRVRPPHDRAGGSAASALPVIVHPLLVWEELSAARGWHRPLTDTLAGPPSGVAAALPSSRGPIPGGVVRGPAPLRRRPRPSSRPDSVPVRLRDLDALVGREWDVALRRLIPFVDGVTHVRAIASAADVAIPVALAGIDHLTAHGLVALVDVFTPEASYRLGREEEAADEDPSSATTLTGVALDSPGPAGGAAPVRVPAPRGARLGRLIWDRRLQSSLLRLVAPDVLAQETVGGGEEAAGGGAGAAGHRRAGRAGDSSGGEGGGGPGDGWPPADRRCRSLVVRDVVRALSLFGRGRTAVDAWGAGAGAGLLQRLGVPPLALIRFATVHGILRRCHVWPTPFQQGPPADEPDAAAGKAEAPGQGAEGAAFVREWRSFLDGASTLDSLCSAARMSRAAVIERLESAGPGWPGFAMVRC